MSTHEYRVDRRRRLAEERALKNDKWTRTCLDAGFTVDEIPHVTVKALHERMYGPVQGRSLIDVREGVTHG